MLFLHLLAQLFDGGRAYREISKNVKPGQAFVVLSHWLSQHLLLCPAYIAPTGVTNSSNSSRAMIMACYMYNRHREPYIAG